VAQNIEGVEDMNADQKKRIAHEISNWKNACNCRAVQLTGDRMAALLQELVDAPEPEPVAVIDNAAPGLINWYSWKATNLPDKPTTSDRLPDCDTVHSAAVPVMGPPFSRLAPPSTTANGLRAAMAPALMAGTVP
jgi:hypothetical protein